MEFSWEVLKPSGRSATGIITFHFILVFLRVSSQCFEEDCRENQSIRIVNATTGECISCFPCLVCTDSKPSVPCGSTVPAGTDIHCARIHPDPSLVSKASAQIATSGIFTSVVTSPSVSSQSQLRLTSTKQIIIEPVTINSHSSVVSAAIPKTYAISSSSTASFGSHKTDEPRKTQESSTKDGQTVGDGGKNVIIIVVTFLVVLTVASNLCIVYIVYRLWKMRSTQVHRTISYSTRNAYKDPKASSVSLMQENSDTCIEDPVATSAEISPARPKDMKQKIKKGKDKIHFQRDRVYTDVVSNVITETVPLSLDVTPREVVQSDDDFLADVTPDPIVNSQHRTVLQPLIQTPGQFNVNPPGSFQSFASTKRGWNAGDMKHQGPATVQWSALSQTDKYKTKMQEAPFPLHHEICLELDIRRNDGKDVRLFAEKLGIKTKEFERLQQSAAIQKTTATSVILKERFSGTVGYFVDVMSVMERDDITMLINEWQE